METLQTFVQVTTPANTLISRITDRVPAILPRETWATWLGETDASLAEVKALQQTFEDGGNWTMTEQGGEKTASTSQTTQAKPAAGPVLALHEGGQR